MRLSPPQFWRVRDSQYRLILTICSSCGKKSPFKRPVCPYCGSDNVRHAESEGYGRVLEYTKVYFRRSGSDPGLPEVVGLIELDEGVKVVGEIVGIGSEDELKEGMRVEAVLRRYASDDPYGVIYYGLKFKPLIPH